MGDFIAGIIGSIIPGPGRKRLERYFRDNPKLALAMLGIFFAGAFAVIVFR